MIAESSPLLEAAVRTATPLLIAALGETISERAGVINIGLEGCIIAGAFAAFVLGATSPPAGYLAATAAGVLVGIILVVFAIVLRRDQIIVGTALTLLALGTTGTLFRARGSVSALVPTSPSVPIPLLSDIPFVGPALFAEPLVTYAAMLLVPAVWWWLYRTHSGLSLRAVGEAPHAAVAAGVRVRLLRSFAVLTGCGMGGLAGGTLVLAQAGTFAEGMSAGRGFLAIAIVALGRWRPAGVTIAACVFGAAMALQFVVQAMGWRVRYELILMIPYVLTLVALGAFGRGVAPAALGRPIED
jgi:ABC-type uncharacterized transport system permease subunit